MKIAVIIVTYNPKKWIDKCFGSLEKSLVPLNVIVVDNNSSDNSQLLIKAKYPKINLIQLDSNIGFGAANNIGISIAYKDNADYFFLLNQDAWIEPNTISHLIYSYKHASKKYGILSPLHFDGTEKALDFHFSNCMVPHKTKSLISDITAGVILKTVYECNFVNAAAWLMTKKCVETIGGFNPSFFHYAEDINYVHRLLFHGLSIGIVPSVKIFHDRQNRKSNLYLEDDVRNFIRHQIKELSNPLRSQTFNKLIVSEAKHLFWCIITLNFIKIRSHWKRIVAVLKINYKDINENKEISLNEGLSFLDI